MTNEDAIRILCRHLMDCGMMMPMDWVLKNGEGSEFMDAYRMAIDALRGDGNEV